MADHNHHSSEHAWWWARRWMHAPHAGTLPAGQNSPPGRIADVSPSHSGVGGAASGPRAGVTVRPSAAAGKQVIRHPAPPASDPLFADERAWAAAATALGPGI